MDKLSGLNLNLLTVLNALLKEKNVSRAAEQLNLTQPTISNSLRQLREIFDDELLLRGPKNKMLLTYKARKLIDPVKEAVAKIENVFYEKDNFDPKKDKYHFRIGMSDYASVICLPKIMQQIDPYTDNIKLTIKHLNNFNTYNEYEKTDIDFAIGNYSASSDKLEKKLLFDSEMVCIANKSHPAFQGSFLSKDDFFKYKHIWVFFKKEYWDEVSEIIQKETGREREVVLQTPHLLVSLSLVENSDYICLSPDKIAYQYLNRYNYKILKSPIKFPLSSYYLFWSKTEANNSASRWFRKIVEKTLF